MYGHLDPYHCCPFVHGFKCCNVYLNQTLDRQRPNLQILDRQRLISLYSFTFLVYCTIHYLQRDKQTEFIFIPNIQIHITQLSQVCMYLPNNNVWKKVVNLNCNKNMYIFSRFHIITFPLEVDHSGTTSLS